MSRKIYAYVKSETCIDRGAVFPGSHVSRNATRVSRHCDWKPWSHGKRKTMAIVNHLATPENCYMRECAQLVAKMLDWY
jgi:hypothetical protein